MWLSIPRSSHLLYEVRFYQNQVEKCYKFILAVFITSWVTFDITMAGKMLRKKHTK